MLKNFDSLAEYTREINNGKLVGYKKAMDMLTSYIPWIIIIGVAMYLSSFTGLDTDAIKQAAREIRG